MKILFVGGGRTFEMFRQMIRATSDENGEENHVRWANHDEAFRGYAGPIHIIYDDHYLAAGTLNAREEENIRYAHMRNEEMQGGNSSRDDQDSGNRRGNPGSTAEPARDGRQEDHGGDVLHYGTPVIRHYNTRSAVPGEEALHGGRKGPLKEL